MATLRFTPAALEHLESLAAFLMDSDPKASQATIRVIADGLRVPEAHPLVGRPLEDERRELVIFRGRSGYLAQYAYLAEGDEVVILAIRHQREVEE